MEKCRVGVIGLRMGAAWAAAAAANPEAELAVVYDRDRNRCEELARGHKTLAAGSEDEFFNAGLDVVVVATPDHFHAEHSVKAMESGSHVICEKPLAPDLAGCAVILEEVKKRDKFFMVGQVCRYTPGFRTAKKLLAEGQIGGLSFLESEYAHDYTNLPGVDNWRKDPRIKREGFIGGGCHALDIIRWLGGDPEEVFCYTSRKLLADWPTDDTGVAVCKLPGGVTGKVFVSVGARRKYTMRTVIYGTSGTIICDNTSPSVKLYREDFFDFTGTKDFWEIPVDIKSHNVGSELKEFIECLKSGRRPPTDVYEGARTVAFGEAALESSRTGCPVKVDYGFAAGGF